MDIFTKINKEGRYFNDAKFKCDIDILLGKEVSSILTFNTKHKHNELCLHSGYNRPDSLGLGYFKDNVFDFNIETGILRVTGRDRFARKFSPTKTKYYRFEIVGFRLKTKSFGESFIWGNPTRTEKNIYDC